ncbi:MAG TPA: gluconate 2-dehydrogenase subunit 3 family protein [Steroidobacteraceae bacterium]|nr:gluconate 2-dehydrogenase subunit 3 family protein [Steroidobacteraceae bacterium]
MKRPQPAIGVTRREVLKTSTVLLGGALLAPALLIGCGPKGRESAAESSASPDQALLEEIADTLLPTTAASPGAKAAGVGPTMVLLLNDCMEADVQQRVAKGLQAFRATSRDAGGDFSSLQQSERERLLRELDVAAQADEEHWFAAVRELALHAYFSSEIGLTRALRYSITPGRYDACVPLQPGQPAWD